jgi:hypothetical protein
VCILKYCCVAKTKIQPEFRNLRVIHLIRHHNQNTDTYRRNSKNIPGNPELGVPANTKPKKPVLSSRKSGARFQCRSVGGVEKVGVEEVWFGTTSLGIPTELGPSRENPFKPRVRESRE